MKTITDSNSNSNGEMMKRNDETITDSNSNSNGGFVE